MPERLGDDRPLRLRARLDVLRTRRLLALAATAAGALAALSAVLLLLTDRSVVVERNTFVNPPGPIDANNSPTVVRNPRSPDNVVVVNRVDRPGFSAALHWSRDGGRTWRTNGLPLPAGKDRPYAPDAAYGPDGKLYVIYVNLIGPGNVPETLWLASSDDGGETLSDPVPVAGKLAFQARLAVDPRGVVYVTYLQATSVGTLQLAGPAHIVAIHSTDSGRSFSEPVPVSDRDRLRVGAASPAIDANGDLVVLYQDFKDDVRDFQNLEGPPWDRPFALVVTRSVDGGRSFSSGMEVESGVVPTRRFLVFLPEFPSLAAAPDGSLLVAWADGRDGDEDVFLRRSDADGQRWREPIQVDDNPAADQTAEQLPKVAVAGNGRVDVLFLERGGDPSNSLSAAVLASSNDGGRTFETVKISSAAFDAGIGPSAAPHLPPDLGSRLGLVSWEDGALAAWTDTRLGSVATGRQDVISARLHIPNLSALRARWLLLVGSLVVAVTALVAWWLMRPPSASAQA